MASCQLRYRSVAAIPRQHISQAATSIGHELYCLPPFQKPEAAAGHLHDCLPCLLLPGCLCGACHAAAVHGPFSSTPALGTAAGPGTHRCLCDQLHSSNMARHTLIIAHSMCAFECGTEQASGLPWVLLDINPVMMEKWRRMVPSKVQSHSSTLDCTAPSVHHLLSMHPSGIV